MGLFRVVKSSGEKELYDREKVLNSIIRSGLSKRQAQDVLKEAEKEFFDGISTDEIHSIIKNFLRKQAFGFHTRYNLKKAFFKLGPTGYPFEKFVARVLQEYGYKTRVDVVLQGRCVAHEIDVLALKEGKFRLVECKFHNSPGAKCNVKIPLYVKARFDDILANFKNKEFEEGRIGSAWIFTNTKFTLDAIAFAECSKMRVTAWSYPRDKSIQKIVEEKGLYPITIFEEVSQERIAQALNQGIITVKDFWEKEALARQIFGNEYLKIKLEAQALM